MNPYAEMNDRQLAAEVYDRAVQPRHQNPIQPASKGTKVSNNGQRVGFTYKSDEDGLILEIVRVQDGFVGTATGETVLGDAAERIQGMAQALPQEKAREAHKARRLREIPAPGRPAATASEWQPEAPAPGREKFLVLPKDSMARRNNETRPLGAGPRPAPGPRELSRLAAIEAWGGGSPVDPASGYQAQLARVERDELAAVARREAALDVLRRFPLAKLGEKGDPGRSRPLFDYPRD